MFKNKGFLLPLLEILFKLVCRPLQTQWGPISEKIFNLSAYASTLLSHELKSQFFFSFQQWKYQIWPLRYGRIRNKAFWLKFVKGKQELSCYYCWIVVVLWEIEVVQLFLLLFFISTVCEISTLYQQNLIHIIFLIARVLESVIKRWSDIDKNA